MATINKNEIIQSGLFTEEINNARDLVKILDSLNEEFKKVSKSAQGVKEGLDLGKVDDLEKFLKLEEQLSSQFTQSTKVLKQREVIMKKINDTTKLQEQSIERLTADLANLRQQRTQLNKREKEGLVTAKAGNAERAKLNVQIKQTSTALNGAISSVTKLTKAEKLELDIQKAQIGSLKRLRLESKKLRNEKDELNLETKEGARRLKEINVQLDKNNAALERNATQLGKQKAGIGRYSKAIKSNIARFVGWTAVIGLATRALRGATKLVIGFEKAQADLAGVLGKSRNEIRELTKDAKKLGATTIFKPQEVSALQKEFAKLGFSVGSIRNMTKATLDFATATNTDLSRSAEVVGNTLNAFQLGSQETTRVVNVMNESFSRSALDTEKFSLAIGKVGAVAAASNFSLEKTTATLGVLVSNGIRAETAGTGLRNILQIVAEKGLDLNNVLKQVNGSTDRVASATKLFGKQNAAVALTMATMQDESKELTEQLEKQGRTAEDVAKEQMATLNGALKQLSSAWDGFILSLEEGDGPLSRAAVKAAEIFTQIINGWTNFNKTVIDGFGDELDKNAEEIEKRNERVIASVSKTSTQTVKEVNEAINKINEDLAKANVARDVASAIALRKEQALLREVLKLRELGVSVEEAKLIALTKVNDESNNGSLTFQIQQNRVIKNEKEIIALTNKKTSLEKKLKEIRKDLEDRGVEDLDSQTFLSATALELKEVNALLAGSAKTFTRIGEEAQSTIGNVSNELLETLIKSSNAFIAELARNEKERRALGNLGTDNDKKQNKTRNSNYKKHLEEKYKLDLKYSELYAELQRDGIDLDSEVLSTINQNRLEALELEIEEEKKLQIDRIEAGQQFEYDKLDELNAEKARLRKEANQIELDEANLQADRLATAERQRIEDFEADRIANLSKRKEDGKVNAEQEAEELKKITDETAKLVEKANENADKRKQQIADENLQRQRDNNEELLKEQRDYNEEVADAELEAYNKSKDLKETQNEEEKKATQDLYQFLGSLSDKYFESENAKIDKNIDLINKQIEASNKRVEAFRQNGSQNRQTLNENIAFEEAKQAKLENDRLKAEEKREKLQKARATLELLNGALQTYSKKVEEGDKTPLLSTATDITALTTFVENLPLFYTGTNTTVGDALGAPTLNTARDGYVVRVDKDEKILNPYLSSLTGNMTTEEIANAAYEKRNGLMNTLNPYDLSNQSLSVSNSMNSFSQMMLVNEMSRQSDKIEQTNAKLDALIDKPVHQTFLDQLGAYETIVQKTTQGNKTVTKNKFLKG